MGLALSAGCRPRAEPSTPSPTALPAASATSAAARPADINPLSGLPVADRSLLKYPALLVSVSNFPATARPQAGLSFAPFVYEFYITEGATRFLAVFYGESPRPEVPVQGTCPTPDGPFVQDGLLLGNRVWLDENSNGVQDPGEEGVSGVCVNLYDDNGLIQRAATDSNGYYGFNVRPGAYGVEFVAPPGYGFTRQHASGADDDSDALPTTGRAAVRVTHDDRSLDAGLVPTAASALTPDPSLLPLPQVGPVRSGRLLYSYLAASYENSCLIYAFASEEVLRRLPQCHMVFHELEGGGYMMSLDEMRSVAVQNRKDKGTDFDYTSNVYEPDPPQGGAPAQSLKVYFAYQNQSGWAYDPLSQSYLRYVDTSEYDQAGQLHPDTDRLTGRQLHFENLIVLYARHEVVSPTNLDIHLDARAAGDAVLFRNGALFKIEWSMPASSAAGRSRPIQFLLPDGSPAPLAPGHTWVTVVTPDSTLERSAPGSWLLNFAQPPGAR